MAFIKAITVDRCCPPLRGVTILFCLAFSAAFSHTQPPALEYQVKAVFLFNFTQFVDWPETALGSADAPLVIGIWGNDPFGSYLDETIRGEYISGHPLVIKRYKEIDEIKTCHILFIPKSESALVKALLQELRGRNILTVSDAPSFVRDGGAIRFFAERHKTRLQVNLKAVSDANLKVSSKLLRLSEIMGNP